MEESAPFEIPESRASGLTNKRRARGDSLRVPGPAGGEGEEEAEAARRGGLGRSLRSALQLRPAAGRSTREAGAESPDHDANDHLRESGMSQIPQRLLCATLSA